MLQMIFLGANLIPEGLETGEFKIGASANLNELMPVSIIAYTRNPQEDGFTDQTPPRSWNNS